MDMARDKYTPRSATEAGSKRVSGVAETAGGSVQECKVPTEFELVETVLKDAGDLREYLESVHCCEVPERKPAPGYLSYVQRHWE